jgi:hypothetical protein
MNKMYQKFFPQGPKVDCWIYCESIEFTQLYSKCHVTSNKVKSNLECAEEKFLTRECGRGVSESGRTNVKKLLPPQAMRGIWLGMWGLVRSYVTLSIPLVPLMRPGALADSKEGGRMQEDTFTAVLSTVLIFAWRDQGKPRQSSIATHCHNYDFESENVDVGPYLHCQHQDS